MAIPPTAAVFARKLDPQEVIDWKISCAALLEETEQIDSFVLTALPEATALGLTILEEPDAPDPVLTDGGRSMVLWMTIDDAFKANPAFDGSGIVLAVDLLIETNSTPARIRNRTVAIQVVHQ